MPIKEACHVAVQRSSPFKQQMWKHVRERQLENGGVVKPVLRIVSPVYQTWDMHINCRVLPAWLLLCYYSWKFAIWQSSIPQDSLKFHIGIIFQPQTRWTREHLTGILCLSLFYSKQCLWPSCQDLNYWMSVHVVVDSCDLYRALAGVIWGWFGPSSTHIWHGSFWLH